MLGIRKLGEILSNNKALRDGLGYEEDVSTSNGDAPKFIKPTYDDPKGRLLWPSLKVCQWYHLSPPQPVRCTPHVLMLVLIILVMALCIYLLVPFLFATIMMKNGI